MSDMTQAERDDVMGAGVAVLSALLHGDLEGGAAILDATDTENLLAFMIRLAHELGIIAAGSPEHWAERLANWQPGQRLGDGF